MQQPDYSKYTEEELRQIRRNIDAERFPERVTQIEQQLTALAAVPRASHANTGSELPSTQIVAAGAWRRIAAFVIDMLILGLAGLAAGAILSKQFAALGLWGRPLGFAIAVAYFGITQSSVGGGRSPGMRLLGLKVIRQDGSLLDPRAAAGRAALFCCAYFLSGLVAYFSGGNPWISGILSTPLFAVYFSIAYLLIFNRKTRQSLHDLAFGAHVVRVAAGPLALPVGSVWRGHAIIAGTAIVVLTIAGMLFTLPIWPGNPLSSMLQLQQAVAQVPSVQNVVLAVNFYHSKGVTVPSLRISTIVDASVSDRDAMARRIAQTALKNYPDADRLSSIMVTLTTGYDIGIAQSFRSWNYSHTPADWKEMP
nr:RDD family protein [uncultured Duganella sp.]